MVDLYRVIRYPNETLITFQGTENDAAEMSKILHFKPMPSKKIDNFEKGYYAYLRGPWREKSEKEALEYLAKNFSRPKLRLLFFKGKSKLPDSIPQVEWKKRIENSICNYFRNKKCHIERDMNRFSIYRAKPINVNEKITINEGVVCSVSIRSDFTPILQVDTTFKYHYDGRIITMKELASREDVDSDVRMKIKKHVTCNSEETLKMAQLFIRNIKISDITTDTYDFSPTPLSGQELNLATWIWSHDCPPTLEFADKKTGSLGSHLFEYEDYKLFSIPSEPLVYIVINPSQDYKQWFSIPSTPQLVTHVESIVKRIFNEEIFVPVKNVEYCRQNSKSVIVSCQNLLEEYKSYKPIFLIITPPKNQKKKHPTEHNNDVYEMIKQIRKIKRGAYSLEINTDNLESYVQKYVIENAILKSVTAVNGMPWKLAKTPLSDNKNQDNLCFIGIDININKDNPVVGGVIFNSSAIPKGWHLCKLPNGSGDHIKPEIFSELIINLLKEYKTATGIAPKHIIVHRDGIVDDEYSHVFKALESYNVAVDIVEIKKSGAPKILQETNISYTPSQDVCMANIKERYAYMITTRVLEEKLMDKRTFPAPNPIAIRQVYGNSDFQTIAAQVYSLTYVNYNSSRRTNSVPITIEYVDALVNNARLKKDQLSHGEVINGKTLYWL